MKSLASGNISGQKMDIFLQVELPVEQDILRMPVPIPFLEMHGV